MTSEGKKCVLGIGAHAADVFGRAGGTIARYVQMGGEGAIVFLSYGERGEAEQLWREEGMTMEKAKEIKKKDVLEAAKALGVKPYILDWDDNPLIFDRERLYQLTDIIREVKPDIVITHWKDDYINWDHATTSEWTVRAVWAASRRGVLTERPPHKVKEVYMFMPSGVSEEVANFRPDVLIDISDTIEIKKKVMACIKSQSADFDYFTEYPARYRGKQAGVQYAEPFVRFTRGYGSGSLKLLPCGE